MVGRDPTCGRTQGKSGPHLTWKDKLKNRNSKLARKHKRKELNEE